ncbi:MAG: hypothetical protein P8P56_01665 [Yoonia sp.]|nr:hypothetical protein [Yoonia sp.]
MIGLAVLIGAIFGLMIVFIMFRSGMLAERSGATMLLVAIASFYPVFAVTSGDPLAVMVHVAIFAGFAALALRGFQHGLYIIAGGLIAHGLFDLSLMLTLITGPTWWPAFCASLDIVAGLAIVRLIQTGKAPR